jgi:WXG100 family type VII secretion target
MSAAAKNNSGWVSMGCRTLLVIVTMATALVILPAKAHAAGQISASPEELRQHASQIRTSENDLRNQLNLLKGELSGLPDEFQGRAYTQYVTLYNTWNVRGQRYADTLESLGKFLNDAATAIEQADQGLASGLGN